MNVGHDSARPLDVSNVTSGTIAERMATSGVG